MDTNLISIIIPVYNIERYLRQCLDSVVNQTYRNLEILIIDDGSTDGSGKICDEYAREDSRIKVFHTENRGLSAARNLGLDSLMGEYIAFLDSDDWLELEAYEKLMDVAIESDADIVECRYFREYVNRSDKSIGCEQVSIVEGDEILKKYVLENMISNAAWNKLYKAYLFENIQYPDSKLYEDIATTYKLLREAGKLVCISDVLIHYRERENSISHRHHMEGLVDYWEAQREKYYALNQISEEYHNVLVADCMLAISRMWRWYFGCSEDDKRKAESVLDEMQHFIDEQDNRKLFNQGFSNHVKATCIFARSRNQIMFGLLYILTQLYRTLSQQTRFE